jgi:anti-sigma factor RsiW
MKDPMFKPCATWAEKLAATHQDDLSTSEWAALEAHIAKCPACAAVREEYRQMDARIRDFPSKECLLNLSLPPLCI